MSNEMVADEASFYARRHRLLLIDTNEYNGHATQFGNASVQLSSVGERKLPSLHTAFSKWYPISRLADVVNGNFDRGQRYQTGAGHGYSLFSFPKNSVQVTRGMNVAEWSKELKK